MKILAIIQKSLREQIRQVWLVLLTISMAPFFVGVYYLMWETSSMYITVSILNLDKGIKQQNHGNEFASWALSQESDSLPISFNKVKDRETGIDRIRNKKTEALLILPSNFSIALNQLSAGEAVKVPFEITGDLSDINYMVAAIWTHEMIVKYIGEEGQVDSFTKFTETPAGVSGDLDEFDLYVPGLIILSTIMLMFTAAIAFVRESEQKTIIRIKLSKAKTWELISGISLVQILIGFISILLTLGIAAGLGFEFSGSWGIFLVILSITCLSIIGFSLIVAALTKTVNQVLIVGNFPLFLFMFFTGAMMPVHGPTFFSFAEYDVTLPGLMSPYHAVQALKKVSIYEAGLNEIWPELICLSAITIFYFIIGAWLFRRKHLRLS
ncbi:MAG: ABC transporter permease [Bacteroidetes bacterium]|nr:ABC transporter permease [Bacteroidota bacterium]